MSREILGLALVATLLAATGIGALAYVNGMTVHKDYGKHSSGDGVMKSGSHGAQDGGKGYMASKHDGERTGHKGAREMREERHAEKHCEGKEAGHSKITETVVINGTVVEVDNTTGIVVIETDNASIAVKIMKRYVDTSNGYIVYGPWLETQLSPGDTIEVVIPQVNETSQVVPALGITIGDSTYLVPPLLGEG